MVEVRVLVVEDDADAADALRMLLRSLGHEARVTRSAVEALDVARQELPDVMLIDIGLPGIDGHELARRLRQDPTTRRVRLIAVTGYGREEDRRRALAAGFDVHVPKPVDDDVLAQVLGAGTGGGTVVD
jgi:CheY-like chemotaxis protein